MPPVDTQIGQLQDAIARLEEQRAVLGDAIVETSLGALRAQLALLYAQAAAPALPGELSPEQLLERLQSYLPKGLAEKMRATGRVESERKQVTVLFADLSGFTALSEQLDPEDVTTLTNEAFKEMADTVYQYEGYIDKLVGDGMMIVFGAPVAHEDDPERALRTALAMRERLEAVNRRWTDRLPDPLRLHIGINSGTAIAGNVGSDLRMAYTVMGDTVNIASRLEDAARPGQILVSRDTYRLTQEAFTFLALEPITVKGKREPLTVFELQRARLHPGKVRGLKELAPAFVGRQAELDQLMAQVDRLTTGQGGIITVAGEAGIGKSRLMAEWRAAMEGRVRWLEGRAFAHTTALSYGPFLDLFRRFTGIKDDDSEVQARDRLQTTVAQLFPGHATAGPLLANLLALRLTAEEEALIHGWPAEVFRRNLFSLIETLFTQLATERPTCLVIEDMHWADRTSVELLEYLLPLTERLPLLIVGLFRLHPDEAPGIFQAIASVRYADRFLHVPLTPLSEAASLALVEQLLTTPDLPPTVRDLIVGKAEGNPFFVEEVIRSLIERGALVRAETHEGWVATPLIETVTVPDTLQGLLMARLDRLPDETRWVVQQASVIGRIFLYRVLLQMASHTSGLDADLSHLEREELIRERTRQPEIEYIFKHALTQEVAYSSLLAPRRKDLHRRVGDAMETLFASRLAEFYPILAGHFWRSESWPQAVHYLILAGDGAARLYANAEARLHYSNAMDALGHLPDSTTTQQARVDTLLKWVRAAILTDSPEQNLARLAEAETLAAALPGADGEPGTDRLRLARVRYWVGRCYYYRNDLREAIGSFRQVLAAAQEFGDEELLAIPASVIGRALVLQGNYGRGAPLLAQAVPLLEKVGDWADWVLTVGFAGVAQVARGAPAAGRVEAQRALERAIAINNPAAISASYCILGFCAMFSGDPAAARPAGATGAQVAMAAGDWLYAYIAYAVQSWGEGHLGDLDAAAQSMARSQEAAERLGSRLVLAPTFATVRAEQALLRGDPALACTLAAEVVAVTGPAGEVLAEGLVQRIWALALSTLATVPWTEVETHLAASLQVLEGGDARLEAARTHLAWAALLRAREEAEAAQPHWDHAAAQFVAAGLDLATEEAQLSRRM